MADSEVSQAAVPSGESDPQSRNGLQSRVRQLETVQSALLEENKSLRKLVENVITHRCKSHGELVLLISDLISRLPINDVGTLVSRLVEHNTHVAEVSNALVEGADEEQGLPQPMVLQQMDQKMRDLETEVKPAVEDLIKLNSPLEVGLLKSLLDNPENFFSPAFVRANRCFIKGQIPRDRIVRQFGEEALPLFVDLTTDANLNPNPKPDEIVLTFQKDFEGLLEQNTTLSAEKKRGLKELHEKVQRGRASTEEAREQRMAFVKLSFLLELLHFYKNKNTEPLDVMFAQRLPSLVEQYVINNPQDVLSEELIERAEKLLAFIISPDHRMMVINNVGKGSRAGIALRYVLKLRAEEDPGPVIPDFIRNMIPQSPQEAPSPKSLAATLRLLRPEVQKSVLMAIMETNRMKREDAQSLGKAAGQELGLKGLEQEIKAAEKVPPEMERQIFWDGIKEYIIRRENPGLIATAVRDRLRAKYDAEELRQSWITMTEADPLTLIKIFCLIPYLPDGSTDSIAQPVLQTFVTRLLHEKYSATYAKVVNSLKNIMKVRTDNPILLNFLALVKWADPEAGNRVSADVGMQPRR